MKRNKINDVLIIREYIRQILLEQDGGGDAADGGGGGHHGGGDFSGGYSGMGGGGGNYSASSMKALGGPAITDILKAGMALVSKTAVGLKRLAKIGFEGMVELLTAGILEAEYEKINSAYHSEISSIESKYADAIGRSWDVLKTSAAPLAMLYSPGLYLTSRIVASNPKALATVAAAFSIAGIPALSVTGVLNGSFISGVTAAAKGVATAAAVSKATHESKNRLFENDSSVIENQAVKEIANEVKKVYDDMLNSSKGMLTSISKALLQINQDKKLTETQHAQLSKLINDELDLIVNEKNKIETGLKQQSIPAGVISQDPLILKFESLIKEYIDVSEKITIK